VRYPKMKEFFVEVSNYKEMHNTAKVGILDKGYFYYKALEAVREIKEHKEDLNVAPDRAYRMFSLARAIQLKPELAQDNAVVDFCYQLQNSIVSTDITDPDQENAEFLKFLNYARLEANQVGYDPALR